MEELMFLPALLKSGIGIFQTLYGLGQAKTPRPQMQMPEGVTTAENIYKNMAGGDMPGMAEATQEIQGSSAAAFNRAKEATNSPASLLGLANNQAYGTGKNLNKLATENADWQTSMNKMLAGFESGVKAPWEQKMWGWNTQQDYNDKMRTSASMIGGGLQNIVGGADSALQSSQNSANNKLMKQYLEMMFGKNKTDNTNGGVTPFYLNANLYKGANQMGGGTNYSNNDWVQQILMGSGQ
jgi:hypothetical protein